MSVTDQVDADVLDPAAHLQPSQLVRLVAVRELLDAGVRDTDELMVLTMFVQTGVSSVPDYPPAPVTVDPNPIETEVKAATAKYGVPGLSGAAGTAVLDPAARSGKA